MNISKREFLKRLGLGSVGLAAGVVMGDDLRPHGAVELGRVPVFILRPCEEDCTAFVSAIEAAIHI